VCCVIAECPTQVLIPWFSWDTRAGSDPAHKHQAHDKEILSVAYHPVQEWLVVTGSADKVRRFPRPFILLSGDDFQTIGLHDLRKPATRVHTFESHTDEVLSLAWSPHNATVFASASSDRRINVWDLNHIGVEQTPDDQEDGPPELLFVHGGT
jgi:histone-binding protein RBBP4